MSQAGFTPGKTIGDIAFKKNFDRQFGCCTAKCMARQAHLVI